MISRCCDGPARGSHAAMRRRGRAHRTLTPGSLRTCSLSRSSRSPPQPVVCCVARNNLFPQPLLAAACLAGVPHDSNARAPLSLHAPKRTFLAVTSPPPRDTSPPLSLPHAAQLSTQDAGSCRCSACACLSTRACRIVYAADSSDAHAIQMCTCAYTCACTCMHPHAHAQCAHACTCTCTSTSACTST